MKKRVGSTMSGRFKKSALSAAMRDLEREIKKLHGSKTSLKKSLNNVSSAIDVDKKKESMLQKKIAKLIEKQVKLNQKRKDLQVKIDNLSDRVGKISKIRSEMADV